MSADIQSVVDRLRKQKASIEKAIASSKTSQADRASLLIAQENVLKKLLLVEPVSEASIPAIEVERPAPPPPQPTPKTEPVRTESDNSSVDLHRLMFDFIYAAIFYKVDYRPGMQKNCKDMSGPLLLTEAQKKIIGALYQLAFIEQKPVRVIILKSRQLGCTTLLLAFAIWLCVTRPGFKVFFIIDKDDHLVLKRKNIISWIEGLSSLAQGMPRVMKGGRGQKIIQLDNGSALLMDSSKSPNPGTSEMVHMLITSEETKWTMGRPEQVKASVFPTIPDTQNSFIIRESTANGSSLFGRDWVKAVRGKGDFIPIFVPWFLSDEYASQNDPSRSHAELKPFDYESDYSDVDFDADVDGREITEKEYQRKYGLSDDQLRWRRRKIDELASRALFDQEYPTTWRHAFRFTGMGYFPAKLVEMLDSVSLNPLLTGSILHESDEKIPAQAFHYSLLRPILERDPSGPLRVWQRPIVGMEYFLAVDCAEGITTPTDEGEDPDFTVITVMDRDGNIVAQWKDRIKPEETWVPLCLLGVWYNHGRIGGELNNAGSLLFQVRCSGYPHLLVHPDRGNTGRSIEDRTWTRVDRGNRNPILQAFRASLVEKPDRCRSASLASECSTFIINKQGKPCAAVGFHDDEVMSAVHAEYNRQVSLGLWKKVEQAPPEPDKIVLEAPADGGTALWQTNLPMDVSDIFLMN